MKRTAEFCDNHTFVLATRLFPVAGRKVALCDQCVTGLIKSPVMIRPRQQASGSEKHAEANGSVKRAPAGFNQARIIDALRKVGKPITSVDIAKASGLSLTRVYQVIGRLREERKVKRTVNGQYTIA